MTFSVECRVHCFRRAGKPRSVRTGRLRRRRPVRIAQRRLYHSEQEPLEKGQLTGAPLRSFRDSEAWRQFFDALQTLEGEVVDAEVTLIVRALRLALEVRQRLPLEFPFMGRLLVQRALSVASLLASLRHTLHPLADSETISAALVVEHVWKGQIELSAVSSVLGPEVASIVTSVTEMRTLVEEVEVLDDATARQVQEQIFEQCDKRAVLLQFMSTLDALCHSHMVPRDALVPLAMDGLYIYVALGRRLEMAELAASLEECCMDILFPVSHKERAADLRAATQKSETVFSVVRQSLEQGMEERRELSDLVDKVEIKTRVKSTSSFLRKELSLSELSKGGRKKEEICDILGVRVIASPKPEGGEEKAVEGCYVIREIADGLWSTVPGRSKDYIRHPKPNGYQSLHSTHIIRLPTLPNSDAAEPESSGRRFPELKELQEESLIIDDPVESDQQFLQRQASNYEEMKFELQIRTQKMDYEAEYGAAAHALYKSGFE